MVKWYHKSLPSLRCGFDSRYPLQPFSLPRELFVKPLDLLRSENGREQLYNVANCTQQSAIP